MKLLVERKWKRPEYTIGILYVNGERFSETCEDCDRGLSQSMPVGVINQKKIYGETAIPTGIYKVVLSVSPRLKNRPYAKKYKGLMPEILDVKGYSGVRIHPFNSAKDSLGCIAPGENKVKGQVINSTKAYYALMDNYIMPAWNAGEEITLEIR